MNGLEIPSFHRPIRTRYMWGIILTGGQTQSSELVFVSGICHFTEIPRIFICKFPFSSQILNCSLTPCHVNSIIVIMYLVQIDVGIEQMLETLLFVTQLY